MLAFDMRDKLAHAAHGKHAHISRDGGLRRVFGGDIDLRFAAFHVHGKRALDAAQLAG